MTPEEFKELPSKEFQNMKICCKKCKSIIVRRNMKKHQDTRTCISKSKEIQDEQIAEVTPDDQAPTIQEDSVTVELGTTFTVFGESIETVKEFKYLGRIVTDTDDDKATVVLNLNKAGKAWGQLHCLLSHEKKQNFKQRYQYIDQ